MITSPDQMKLYLYWSFLTFTLQIGHKSVIMFIKETGDEKQYQKQIPRVTIVI